MFTQAAAVGQGTGRETNRGGSPATRSATTTRTQAVEYNGPADGLRTEGSFQSRAH